MFINLRDAEERNNGLKTFLIGGSFIMCLWIGMPYLIRTYLDPAIGSFHNPFLRWLGGPLSLLGYALAVWCVMLFIKEGKGTPLPYAHPKKLVLIGPYRYVRNPMVLGTVIFLLGSAFLLGSWGILAYAAVIFLIMHVFVLVEERALTARFGGPYTAYVRSTPRWWPCICKSR
ncbi:MAG: isoprenylcysteine carboxylmethyltransferase family protein [Candidatus Omnitrophica bacterium]|nr:isoprenylcysteine carboxylmethyltransferase family protein [Candidatus Omnitrophota bacterium]